MVGKDGGGEDRGQRGERGEKGGRGRERRSNMTMDRDQSKKT